MFGIEFYPTPEDVINVMLDACPVNGKIVLEPSAGKGNIVTKLLEYGATEVLACEIDPKLRAILGTTGARVIGNDFLTIQAETISHIDCIYMNPPFSNAIEHINHAFTIAPEGCTVVALFNHDNLSSSTRGAHAFKTLIDLHGYKQELGKCFSTAERTTDVNVGMVVLRKPASSYEQEFEGFFTEEDPEEQQYSGIMPYNLVRDIVNRYVNAVKLYDKQLELAVQMNQLTGGFFQQSASLSLSVDKVPTSRATYKKELQKSAWEWIFKKMDMQKLVTSKLKADLNKFVETQSHIPFTMRNIYKMLEVVIGTHASRMDSAILAIADKLTRHTAENRHNVEGWKSNSNYYLVNRMFVVPYVCEMAYGGALSLNYHSEEFMSDLLKALCYVTGIRYEDCADLRTVVHKIHYKDRITGKILNGTNQPMSRALDDFWYKQRINAVDCVESGITWGKWFDWNFFEVRMYKKGTAHFRFKDENTWALFIQSIARILGAPLPQTVTKSKKKK